MKYLNPNTHPVIFNGRTIRRELRAPVHRQLPGGGESTTMEKCGEEDVQFAVIVDLAALDDLARKAARSKGQRARDGAITVEIQHRRRIA